MVTHNLRYAVEYGNRMLMMHEGRAVLDVSGADKQAVQVSDLLRLFNEISVECGTEDTDRLLRTPGHIARAFAYCFMFIAQTDYSAEKRKTVV